MKAILFVCVLLVLCILVLYKNNATIKAHYKIVDAIFIYKCQCEKHCIVSRVDYKDMESYERTFWRLWDIGYKHILPKEKYELIKEFIK